MFWSDERITSWEKAIFPDGIYVDHAYNLMCLSPSAHRYHSKGYFALKPIYLADDKKKLTLEFHWLSKGRGDHVRLTQKPCVESSRGGPVNSRLIDHDSVQLIQSGHRITMTTNDPVENPLPKWEIMEMQWFLNRIVAISGAAGVDSDYTEDDEDDLDQHFTLTGSYSDLEDAKFETGPFSLSTCPSPLTLSSRA